MAINTRGELTRANSAARRTLRVVNGRLEGLSIGALLVKFLPARRGNRATLSLYNWEGQRDEMLVVLGADKAEEEPERQAEPAPVVQQKKSSIAERQVADFIAHELRTPLGTILGMSQLLSHRFEQMHREDRDTALRTVHEEAQKALLILEGLLRLAEARTTADVELSTVPLHAVIGRVIQAHKKRFPYRQVALTGDAPLFANANSLWVELALANLLSNAEKYTPHEQPIELTFHQNGSRATILVLDHGEGLLPERYEALWEPYFRGPEASASAGGVGIGLALCKELIERMGGHVWAGPRNTGGSVFALSLPTPWDKAVPADLSTRMSQKPAPPRAETQGGGM